MLEVQLPGAGIEPQRRLLMAAQSPHRSVWPQRWACHGPPSTVVTRPLPTPARALCESERPPVGGSPRAGRVHDVGMPVSRIVASLRLVDHRVPGAPCVPERALAPGAQCTLLRIERKLVRKLRHDAPLEDCLARPEHPNSHRERACSVRPLPVVLVGIIGLSRTPSGHTAQHRHEPVVIVRVVCPHLDDLRLSLSVYLFPVQRTQPCNLVLDPNRDPPLLSPPQRVLLHEHFQLVVRVRGEPDAASPLYGAFAQSAPEPAALLVGMVDVPERRDACSVTFDVALVRNRSTDRSGSRHLEMERHATAVSHRSRTARRARRHPRSATDRLSDPASDYMADRAHNVGWRRSHPGGLQPCTTSLGSRHSRHLCDLLPCPDPRVRHRLRKFAIFAAQQCVEVSVLSTTRSHQGVSTPESVVRVAVVLKLCIRLPRPSPIVPA